MGDWKSGPERSWDERLEDEVVLATKIAFIGGTLDPTKPEDVRAFVLSYLEAHGATLDSHDRIIKQEN